jgi:hypothetical protein
LEQPLARPRAHPTVGLYTRLSLEDEARRRRLEALLNCKTTDLIGQALNALEQSISNRTDGDGPTAALNVQARSP